jgi:hypothetical protein
MKSIREYALIWWFLVWTNHGLANCKEFDGCYNLTLSTLSNDDSNVSQIIGNISNNSDPFDSRNSITFSSLDANKLLSLPLSFQKYMRKRLVIAALVVARVVLLCKNWNA